MRLIAFLTSPWSPKYFVCQARRAASSPHACSSAAAFCSSLARSDMVRDPRSADADCWRAGGVSPLRARQVPDTWRALRGLTPPARRETDRSLSRRGALRRQVRAGQLDELGKRVRVVDGDLGQG